MVTFFNYKISGFNKYSSQLLVEIGKDYMECLIFLRNKNSAPF